MRVLWHKGICTDAFDIRDAVFCGEQGCSLKSKQDEIDSCAYHIMIYDEDTPIATGRVFMEGDEARMGRICVIKGRRGEHIGKKLVEEMIKVAFMLSDRIVIHSQTHAVDFYKPFGFVSEGEIFYKENIPHVCMVLESYPPNVDNYVDNPGISCG